MQLIDLVIQGAPVINDANTKQAHGQQVDQTGDPFALVKAVNAKHAKECEQHPGNVVIDRALQKATIGAFVHARYQEQIHNPADQEQAERKEPDDAGDGPAVIKTVSAHETENPENVSDDDTVAVVVGHMRSISMFQFPDHTTSNSFFSCVFL